MSDLIIGKGNLSGKGVYAGKNFKKGYIVIKYNLRPLTQDELNNLPENEKKFVHTHWGQKYLYLEPERYVNHSASPNTHQDLFNKCDIALYDIKEGEMITADATKDDVV